MDKHKSMPSQTEEKWIRIVKDAYKAAQNEKYDKINDRFAGVFIIGVIVGIIFSYTGFLGFFTGIIAGILVNKNFDYHTGNVIDKLTYVFFRGVITVKTELNKQADRVK
jgi:hypothetical protein